MECYHIPVVSCAETGHRSLPSTTCYPWLFFDTEEDSADTHYSDGTIYDCVTLSELGFERYDGLSPALHS